jgi:hypothetical protein
MELPVYPNDFSSPEEKGFESLTDARVNEELAKTVDEYLNMPAEEFPDILCMEIGDVTFDLDVEEATITVSRVQGIATMPAELQEKLKAKQGPPAES